MFGTADLFSSLMKRSSQTSFVIVPRAERAVRPITPLQAKQLRRGISLGYVPDAITKADQLVHRQLAEARLIQRDNAVYSLTDAGRKALSAYDSVDTK